MPVFRTPPVKAQNRRITAVCVRGYRYTTNATNRNPRQIRGIVGDSTRTQYARTTGTRPALRSETPVNAPQRAKRRAGVYLYPFQRERHHGRPWAIWSGDGITAAGRPGDNKRRPAHVGRVARVARVAKVERVESCPRVESRF